MTLTPDELLTTTRTVRKRRVMTGELDAVRRGTSEEGLGEPAYKERVERSTAEETV